MAIPINAQSQKKLEQPPAPALVRVPLRDLLNLPNSLTLLRLFSIPLFLGLLGYRHYRAALYVFGFAALTDSLDGTVARWFDAKTELGAFLDPFADKLMLVSAFVVLTMDGDFPPWLFGIVIIRDVVIVFGYFLLSFLIVERIPVRPSYIGKGSTFFQLACVVAALARLGQVSPEYFNYLLYTTAGFTALSGVHYIYRGLEILFNREPGMFE
jgi:cardiolipin synthase